MHFQKFANMQVATTNDKVAQGFNFVSMKFIQLNIQICITWIKNLTKGSKLGTKHA
jgi:hypothetical protein